MTSSDRRPRRRSLAVGAVLLIVGSLVLAIWNPHAAGTIEGAPGKYSPSGVLAPVGDIDGWRQIFVDDFDRTELGDDWGSYEGIPAGDPYSWWQPSHVRLYDSQLVLEGYPEDGRWTTGGVSNFPVSQTYGKWEVRFRIDASDEITMHFLLWPKGGDWPPEIDFLENGGGNRTEGSGSVIYRDGAGRGREHRSVLSDFTQWQTVGVEWLPGRVTYTLNGEPWGEVVGDVVPSQPMWLAMQAQSGGCQRKAAYGDLSCPVAGIPFRADVQIDWVAIYAPN